VTPHDALVCACSQCTQGIVAYLQQNYDASALKEKGQDASVCAFIYFVCMHAYVHACLYVYVHTFIYAYVHEFLYSDCD
jgi:hypothetical protein